MFKIETKNNVTKYSLDSLDAFSCSWIDAQYQSVLAAAFHGVEYTPVVQCYCGHIKPISGLVCRACQGWSNQHR